MDDSQIHGSIEQLVAEEHELWERESAGNASEADRQRLRALKISLDQCWDLLRQRAESIASCLDAIAILLYTPLAHSGRAAHLYRLLSGG